MVGTYRKQFVWPHSSFAHMICLLHFVRWHALIVVWLHCKSVGSLSHSISLYLSSFLSLPSSLFLSFSPPLSIPISIHISPHLYLAAVFNYAGRAANVHCLFKSLSFNWVAIFMVRLPHNIPSIENYHISKIICILIAVYVWYCYGLPPKNNYYILTCSLMNCFRHGKMNVTKYHPAYLHIHTHGCIENIHRARRQTNFDHLMKER